MSVLSKLIDTLHLYMMLGMTLNAVSVHSLTELPIYTFSMCAQVR